MLTVKKLTGTIKAHRREVTLMGNRFEINVLGHDENWANTRIDSAINEINRVEQLLSPFNDSSIISLINRNAGKRPVVVNAEIFGLISRAVQISDLTHGGFDITYKAAGKKLKSNTAVTNKTAANFTNYKNIVLDATANTVFLKNKEIRIGFGAISRGYAADRAKYILQMEGVSSGVINAGGQLLSWGLQENKTPWTIAAADPSQTGQPYANINISNMAVATSFNAEQLIINNNSTIDINPDNGFPVSKINRVSIITTGAEFADAMVAPIIAMGINAGLYLINKLNQMACIIVDDHSRVYTSKDINLIA
ncbi:FAD:protein FMN transferase [Mucilaginibacter segetis]|uniref:FAD:protein FMN transferase n=1 Tax=Mucilaginibacter segetis TaxID=2793071 RepID=A0A934UNB8_9SPHI|nr:FAD:protein FMN transferase [Mucilaginibacter segetis]MBK0379747.1 FAD:protein FMN transferase [Mucilaginibacter segetis]